MPDPLRALKLNAVEALRQPGTRRTVVATFPPEMLGVDHARVAGDVAVDVTAESLNDGITVVGTVRAPWAGACRRCLADVAGDVVAEVDELYQIEITGPDAFEIEDGQLDLAPMVRESILLELDAERLCRETCAGLCPTCGVDRNETSCDCDDEVRDDRWAALAQIVLDDE